jgi:hypothetical protein
MGTVLGDFDSERVGGGWRVDQFEEVAAQADEGPLTANLCQSSEGEASEAPGLLCLTEYRLRDHLSPGVDLTPLFCAELLSHGAPHSLLMWRRFLVATGTVFDTADSQVGVDSIACSTYLIVTRQMI